MRLRFRLKTKPYSAWVNPTQPYRFQRQGSPGTPLHTAAWPPVVLDPVELNNSWAPHLHSLQSIPSLNLPSGAEG